VTTTLPEPQTLTDEDHGTRGRIGPFDWDLWEDGGKRAKLAVHHTASSSLLAFFRKPGECREYITSGQAQADYAGKRTEGEKS